MRRLVSITAFALFLTVPVWAQRGGHGGGFSGGHVGGFGGGHVGFGAGHGGGFAGHAGFGHGFTSGRSTRIGGPAAVGSFTAHGRFSRGPFLHDGFGDGFRGNRFHHRFGFRNNCFGFNCWAGFGYPWGWGYIDPLWWDSGSRYFDEYDRDREIAERMNEENIEEQRMLRQEEADGDRDDYMPRHAEQRQQSQSDNDGAAMMPPTVLVFRDQHKVEVQNYAIVGNTLWAFAPQHQKIPLSDVDLTATARANDDRGTTFRVPAANVGQ